MAKQTVAARKRRSPPQRNREVTGEQILVAAEKLFLEKGFRATSLQDIASEAGYTTGAIYSSFDGKDDLFLAVYRRKAQAQHEVWRVALAEAATSKDPAQALGSALTIARLQPAWQAAIYEFFSYASRDERLSREVADVHRGGNEAWAELLKDMSGSSPLPLDRLAQIVLGLLRGLAWTWFIDPDLADVTLVSDAVALLIGETPPSNSNRPSQSRRKRQPRPAQ